MSRTVHAGSEVDIAMRLHLFAAVAGAGLCFALASAPQSVGAADVPASAAAAAPALQPEALQALRRMSDYLTSLKTVQITTRTSLDLVTTDGHLIQINGGATYKLRRPDGFVIDVKSDVKDRTFFYDGKEFTVYAPELGYYATVAAPPTIRETLDKLYAKFGLSLPLEDLFRWGDATDTGDDVLDSGFLVGSSTIDGVATDHYAFCEGDIDWQVWIQKGDRPLPRKLVIINRSDPASPAYSAVLDWNLNPTFAADEFVFKPAKDAKSVRLTLAQ
jgi:hypothetical protein